MIDKNNVNTLEKCIVRRFADNLIKLFRKDSDLNAAELNYDIDTIEQAVEDYAGLDMETGDHNPWKEMLKEWNVQTLKKVPDANLKVLEFITDMTCHKAASADAYAVIRNTFHTGYCYYFAHMLKIAFKRGEVCWAAPFGHFVWVDTNGIAYDVDGVNFGDQMYNIPESYLCEMVKGFTHIPGEESSDMSKTDIIRIIRKFEDDKHLLHQDINIF